MPVIKLTYIVWFTTATTLLLQILLFYRNQCHLSNTANTQEKISKIKIQNFEESYKPITSLNRRSMVEAEQRPLLPKPANKRRLTIAIPTINRRDGNYFHDMLKSMLNKTSDNDLKDIIFVIFLADFNNTFWKTEMEMVLKSNYSKYIESGSLQVIQAPEEFYNGLRRYGNNSYMNWRTKQNYDYAYLMRYCEYLSEYYMQMEDDVIASDGYYSAINEFIENQTDDTWICLEFSELGFIGKLYHSKHIRHLSDMLVIFSHTQPVDYTYSYYNMLLNNGLKKLRRPTLFQHMGYHSSLTNKIQQLQDKYFDFPAKEWNGDNPSAKIYTTLKENTDFASNLPYVSGPGHFWSYSGAKENDTYSVVFDSAHLLDKVVVVTGSKEHPSDVIHNGILEASAVVSGSRDDPVCDDLIVLGTFKEGNILVDAPVLRSKLGLVKIRCLQIRITRPQIEWVVLKEIAVFFSRN